jgi:hypothetical protein
MPVEDICQICKYQETSCPVANNNGSQEMQTSVVLSAEFGTWFGLVHLEPLFLSAAIYQVRPQPQLSTPLQ